jgi:CRP-like cAMP-binding protein
MDESEIILGSALFSGMSKDELTFILECLECRKSSYSRGAVIAVAGSSQSHIGLVLSGKISISKESMQGQRMLLTVGFTGDSYGEMNVFSGSRIWAATVIADTACSILSVPIDKINSSCEKRCLGHWSLILNISRLVSSKALILSKTIDYLGVKGIKRKLSKMILDMSEISGIDHVTLPMSRVQLADCFFVSRPALSREMCVLRDSGAIVFNNRSVSIINKDILKRFSEFGV